MNNSKQDKYYLGIALAVSKASEDVEYHWGYVIVKDEEIVLYGYNKYSNDNMNAVTLSIKARTKGANTKGATAYFAGEMYGKDSINSVLRNDDIFRFSETEACIPSNEMIQALKNLGVVEFVHRGGVLCFQ